jgi:hypothetical protein
MKSSAETLQEKLRAITSVAAIAVFGLFVLGYLIGLIQLGNLGVWDEVVKAQFKAAVGVPLSALAALCLVFLFRVTSGAIEVKLLGLEFKGAAGPLIVWVIVFLAMIAGIQTLWTNTATH